MVQYSPAVLVLKIAKNQSVVYKMIEGTHYELLPFQSYWELLG